MLALLQSMKLGPTTMCQNRNCNRNTGDVMAVHCQRKARSFFSSKGNGHDILVFEKDISYRLRDTLHYLSG